MKGEYIRCQSYLHLRLIRSGLRFLRWFSIRGLHRFGLCGRRRLGTQVLANLEEVMSQRTRKKTLYHY